MAYARERHIEIIPEIDMPGHFCAAMAAYPEYSCTPEGNHNVSSAIGGIFADVMNVANPQAVQFAKDILTEIMDIFPGNTSTSEGTNARLLRGRTMHNALHGNRNWG